MASSPMLLAMSPQLPLQVVLAAALVHGAEDRTGERAHPPMTTLEKVVRLSFGAIGRRAETVLLVDEQHAGHCSHEPGDRKGSHGRRGPR